MHCTRSPASPPQLPPALPAHFPPSAPPTPAARSAPLPPATDAPHAGASTRRSPLTYPSTTRSAPATASGSATPANPTSTSPPAPKSSPLSVEQTGSFAAAHPSSSRSLTRPQPEQSLPGRSLQARYRTTGGIGSSCCRPPTNTEAFPPTMNPSRTHRSTPTPSPSPQPNSTLAPPGQNDWQTLPQHPAGQLRWHDADHFLANPKGPRRSRAHYRAEMPVTGQWSR